MHDHATSAACPDEPPPADQSRSVVANFAGGAAQELPRPWAPGDVVHFADGSAMVIVRSTDEGDEWLDEYLDRQAPATGGALVRLVLVVGCVGSFITGAVFGWWL